MSALTPDCDPDMSHCGQPWQGKSGPGATVLSVAVLLTILAASLAVVATRAVSGQSTSPSPPCRPPRAVPRQGRRYRGTAR